MDLGYQNMIFKTGRKMVVDNIASTYSGVSDFHVILAKCRPLISNLSNSWVSFIQCQTNQLLTH